MNRQIFQEVLPLIQTPSHYLGSEINAIHKDRKKVRFRMALSFPDRYEIGMSHLGIQLLYHILNAREDVAAERVFAPRRDMEAALRDRGLSLVSLETKTPLVEFDVIGFSLLYELNFTNVLNMLDLSRIPLYARDRNEADPVVIAGGPCTFNPEPLADFFDAMVIGDGEEVIMDIVDQWLRWKESGDTRQALLKRWSRLKGVYIPSFFGVRYDARGNPVLEAKTERVGIQKAIVADLNNAPYPNRPIVPFGRPVHDRVSLEICRGCTRGCRFCQAGMIYRPVREREPTRILALGHDALRYTGYEDVSLLSLSTGDYTQLPLVMEGLMARCEPDNVAVSLPSLRVGSLTEAMMKQIIRVRKTGFTLAPEAGSERLRHVINKNISEKDLVENVSKAFSLGWRLVKLYFMVGLPTETQQDVDAIILLVKRLKKLKGTGVSRKDITASVSTFIPKAHTPFQWAPQITLAESRERIRYLRERIKGRGLRFKWQNPEMSALEGLLARGDRQLAPLLVTAFEMGCRFDGWSDQFRFDIWQRAFERVGIDPDFYRRSRKLDDPLPWDHIHTGVNKEFLCQEWKRALQENQITDCRQGECHVCGVCDFEKIQPITVNKHGPLKGQIPARNSEEPTSFKKLQISYSKLGFGRFFGHLEMVKIFIRAFKRAHVPVRFSQGFHPSPKMRFSAPLPVGMESVEESFWVDVPLYVRPENILKKINDQLPEGLAIIGCKEVDSIVAMEPSMASYRIRLKEGVFSSTQLEKFERCRSWMIERRNKKGRIDTIDIKRGIVSVHRESPKNLRVVLDASRQARVRPLDILEHVFALSQRDITLASIVKEPVAGDDTVSVEKGRVLS